MTFLNPGTLFIAICFDPPVWVGEAPRELSEPIDVNHLMLEMGEEVLRSRELGDIEVRVTRDGVFAFDLTSWESASQSPKPNAQFPGAPYDAVLNRATLMNAFLAFFYTHEYQRGVIHRRMFITPDDLFRMFAITGPITGTTVHTVAERQKYELARSTDLSTYDLTKSVLLDPRIAFRRAHEAIPIATINGTLTSLKKLLNHDPADGLLLAELFHRASTSYENHNFNTALILNWAIAEMILREMWTDYLSSNQQRSGKSFLTRKRADNLRSGRDYTAAVVAEILSLTDVIDLELYEHVTEVRIVRNRWIHQPDKSISMKEAHSSGKLAEKLLLRGRDIELITQSLLTWSG